MKRPKSITIFSSLYPFAVLFLAPEIIYSVFFSCWYIIELINRSDFGRTMESYVGLGLIGLIIVYGVFIVVGIVTLSFVIWRIIRAIIISKKLLNLSEKARKIVIFTNVIYATFIICAFFLCNYCNLPGRSYIKSYSSANQKNISCAESDNRNIIKTIDMFIFPYFAFSVYFFSRRKTKKLFKMDNTDGMRVIDCSHPVIAPNNKVQVHMSLINYINNYSRNIGKQILGSYPNISGITKKRVRSLKDQIKTTYRMRTGNKSTAEKIISAMGWTNILLILLAIPTKLILLLYFMSTGWASVLRAFIDLISGRTIPSLTTLNSSGIIFIVLGTSYSLYHIILTFLFLLTLRKVTRISTYLWGTLSVIILVIFTIMGFNFSWT